jgi:hypothetical protein
MLRFLKIFYALQQKINSLLFLAEAAERPPLLADGIRLVRGKYRQWKITRGRQVGFPLLKNNGAYLFSFFFLIVEIFSGT